MEKEPKDKAPVESTEWDVITSNEADIQPSDSTEPLDFDTDAKGNVVEEAKENSKERFVLPDGTSFYGTPEEFNQEIRDYHDRIS